MKCIHSVILTNSWIHWLFLFGILKLDRQSKNCLSRKSCPFPQMWLWIRYLIDGLSSPQDSSVSPKWRQYCSVCLQREEKMLSKQSINCSCWYYHDLTPWRPRTIKTLVTNDIKERQNKEELFVGSHKSQKCLDIIRRNKSKEAIHLQ